MTFVYSDTFCFYELFNSHSLSTAWLTGDTAITLEIFTGSSVKDSRLLQAHIKYPRLITGKAIAHPPTQHLSMAPPSFLHLLYSHPLHLFLTN